MKTANKNGSRVWVFKNQNIPARVVELLKNDDIRKADLLLLFVIGDQVKHYSDGTGTGCYQKNETLGHNIGTCATYVSDRLKYLESIGLILIVRIGKYRYLELEWSRTAEERTGLQGNYGKALRKAHARMIRRLEDEASTKVEGTSKKTTQLPERKQDRKKVEAVPSTKVEAVPSTKVEGHTYKSKKSEKTKSFRHETTISPDSDSFLHDQPSASQTDEIAQLIRRASATHHHVAIPKSSGLIRAVEKVSREIGAARLQDIAERYFRVGGDVSEPRVCCIKSVRTDILLWLEKSLDRVEGKAKRDVPEWQKERQRIEDNVW